MDDIRICPPTVEFRDADVGGCLKQTVKIINVGKLAKEIRFTTFRSKYFVLKFNQRTNGLPVAPGLSAIATITYLATDDIEIREELVVTVDGHAVRVPIYACPPKPLLSVSPAVQFGLVVRSSRVVMRELHIYNHGSRDGEFNVVNAGNLSSSLTVIPTTGTVHKNSALSIRIELVAEKVGKFDEVLQIHLEGQPASVVHLIGNVVNSSLQLLGFESDEPLKCLSFGPTYYDSDVTQCAMLYNNGPECTRYVILLNDYAQGQLTGQAKQNQGQPNCVQSMVDIFPTNGTLQPYEKTPIYLHFSPRWYSADKGFKCSRTLAPCQDFSVFVQVLKVGSDKPDANANNPDGSSALEIGLTGRAVPVNVELSAPATSCAPYDKNLILFGQCNVGSHVGLTVTMTNRSNVLPVTYQFQRIANFTVQPSRGHLTPGQTVEITVTFSPNQIGNFNYELRADVLSKVMDCFRPFSLVVDVVHTVSLKVQGSSYSNPARKDPVFNKVSKGFGCMEFYQLVNEIEMSTKSTVYRLQIVFWTGITPKITNEVGVYVGDGPYDMSTLPRNSRYHMHKTKAEKRNKASSDNALIALPNDRSRSVGPSDRYQSFRTIFAGIGRYTYVDPDYAYTDDEMESIRRHKQFYLNFIKSLNKNRHHQDTAREHMKFDNSVDIGMRPAAGLKSPALKIKDQLGDQSTHTSIVRTTASESNKLLSLSELSQKTAISSMQVKDGLNAVPTTKQEKADCQKVLTPVQLHQITVEPSTVNCGRVCPKSTTQKDVNIINSLDQYIHVVINIDCKELRQTSPLSYVIPPMSTVVLPVVFESTTKGHFQRSVTYTVNGFYQNFFTVFAEVVPVQLELSSDNIVLESRPGLPPDSSVRGVVTLYNRLNTSTDFTWNPIVGEHGTAFSIRPASGTVDAFSDLCCEIVFHPSFFAPSHGEFALQVHGGLPRTMQCSAKLGSPNVQMVDRRVTFGQVPLRLTKWRLAALKNSGAQHAYFQVLNPNPFPGLSLSPVCGSVPVGGVAFVCATLASDSVIKFDTQVTVAVRNGKNIDMRVGGTVEPPHVDIDMEKFHFGGVYCGATARQQFTLCNKGSVKAQVEFDLSQYRDFQLDFGDNQTTDDLMYQRANPGLYMVSLNPEQSIQCQLSFTPSEVASYDFVMGVCINETLAPSPAVTPLPSAPSRSIRHIVTPKPQDYHVVTPRRKVVATALRQPLQLSSTYLTFSISQALVELGTCSNQCQKLMICNVVDRDIEWNFVTSDPVLNEGVFQFIDAAGAPFVTGSGDVGGVLSPGETETICVKFAAIQPGHYQAAVPIVLNGDHENPYQILTLTGELKPPNLHFDPPMIVFSAVPLNVEMSADVSIVPVDFPRTAVLATEPFSVECEDGGRICPLTVTFKPNTASPVCYPTQTIEASSLEDNGPVQTIYCRVTFRCSKPVSFSQRVVFCDNLGNAYSLMVTATADNCMLTSYPYFSQQHEGRHIIYGTSQLYADVGSGMGEPQLLTSDMVTASRPTSTMTSSTFGISSSTYETTSTFDTSGGTSSTRSTPAYYEKDSSSGGVVVEDAADDLVLSRHDTTVRSLRPLMFPDRENDDEGEFFHDVIRALQRWYCMNGWPGPLNPVVIPDSFRSGLTRRLEEERSKTGKIACTSSAVEKVTQTIYDMVTHLSGKALPDVDTVHALPVDASQRAQKIYSQHCTLLMFIKSQGGCVANIRPEYLMEPQDYQHWMKMQSSSGVSDSLPVENAIFESLSKRAWTDLLLQMIKTLVLARITPRQLRNMPSPYKDVAIPSVDADPLCSNVYSIGERIILAWLNQHYEQMRHSVWCKSSVKGGIPPARWIVNFDYNLLDSLVLAAVLAAHAPFLIEREFIHMYTRPSTAEQCLHNALCVVNAMKSIGIDYDIQAIDLTDPNPICMLLLCIHLYSNLPNYLPRSVVQFEGLLHGKVSRQVKLNNPSNKPIMYNAIICGRDACDFAVSNGPVVTVPAKSGSVVTVDFVSRMMRPSEAVLLLTGRRHGAMTGCVLAFTLQGSVNGITPSGTVFCETPCYVELQQPVTVRNCYAQPATFRVLVVEIDGEFPGLSLQDLITSGVPKNSKQLSNAQLSTGQGPSLLRAFFCQTQSVFIAAGSTTNINFSFLPFSPGYRQCAVILTNDEVGEMLYVVTANGLPPLPETAVADESTGPNVEWSCEIGQEMVNDLLIPVRNVSKEKALVVAARLLMADKELHRHAVTGSLNTNTVLSSTMKLLSKASGENSLAKYSGLHDSGMVASNVAVVQPLQAKGGHVYCVELDNPKHFTALASSVIVPDFLEMETCSPALGEYVRLPVKFIADQPGLYACRFTLRHANDVRVFGVQCTVKPQGSHAYVEFCSPVNQAVVQNIPICNTTKNDWNLSASVQGEGFSGPSQLVAPAGSVTQYALQFLPRYEKTVEGQLKLVNSLDGVEHVFVLQGKGDRPVPLDVLKLKMITKQNIAQLISVPNLTKKKIHFRVESDLNFLSGPDSLDVLPGQTGYYELSVRPLRRGHYTGVLAFRADPQYFSTDVDSDGESVDDDWRAEMASLEGYYLWYAVDINVGHSNAQASLTITCACHQSVLFEVGITNPTDQVLILEASLTGHGLQGPTELKLEPQARHVYQATFTPTTIGVYNGSLIMYNDMVGEFWYHLELNAQPPMPTVLPPMTCELGTYVQQKITLHNSCDEVVHLTPTISNEENFVLELDTSRPLALDGHSSVEVPLTFVPSKLGAGDQSAVITFRSVQLGDWVFNVNGVGLLPGLQQPVSVTATLADHSTVLVPFRNPTDVHVAVDVFLKHEDDSQSASRPETTASQTDTVPFCLLLKSQRNVLLGPRSTLQIPVSFLPQDMYTYRCRLWIAMRREDGALWTDDSDDTGLTEIVWVYPITGHTEVAPPKNTVPALFETKSRQRLEQRLEVVLTGVVGNTSSAKQVVRCRPVTPADVMSTENGTLVSDMNAIANVYSYELVYTTNDAKTDVEPTVALQLIRQQRSQENGFVTLTFNVIYAPFKMMRHRVLLSVQCATGGRWSFPLDFVSTEPEPDDTIYIEAVGLNKMSTVSFYLLSPTEYMSSYTATFAPEAYDTSEFSVFPQTGILPPSSDSPGTKITVGFAPRKYGRIGKAKLVIQTADVHWTYQIHGVLPVYKPPVFNDQSKRSLAAPPPPRITRKPTNFIQENLRLTTTAVSSPIKGGRLMAGRLQKLTDDF